jgi:hypothetical protein
MPDRLGDFLDNSVPARHHLVCPRCGDVVKASTALAAQLLMKTHRKFKCPNRVQKGNALSIMEQAQELMALGESAPSAIIGTATAAGEGLNTAMQGLEQAQQQLEEMVGHAGALLGQRHAQLNTIAAAAAPAANEIQNLQGMIRAVQEGLTALDGKIMGVGTAIVTAGQHMAGGGA